MQKIIFFRPSQLARTKNGNELLQRQSSSPLCVAQRFHLDFSRNNPRCAVSRIYSVESIEKENIFLLIANGFEFR